MSNQRKFKLDLEYTCLLDATDKEEWNCIIPLFRDATVNQTWAYCQVRSKNNSHLVLKRNGTVVAASVVRLVVLPVLKRGIAYVGSGPMWRLRGEADNIQILRKIVQALREEYVVRRRLFLRISPNIFTNLPDHKVICSIFEEEGFTRKNLEQNTLFLDLEPSIEDLRKGLHQKWRNELNHAEKNNLTIREGMDSETFRTFRSVYEEMHARKQYSSDVDMNEYEAIQNALPEPLKPRIVMCESDGRPMAGAVFSTIGDTGIYLLGATSNEGIKNQASYLVQWHMIKWLKECGFRMYDLGGCSPNTNKGTYHFKAGICGKRPELFTRIGVMEACDSTTSRLIVRSGEVLSSFLSGLKK